MCQSLYRINKIVKVIIEITKTLNPLLNLIKFSFDSKTLNNLHQNQLDFLSLSFS